MNIYLLTQSETIGYDVYDSMVVVAESAEEAKKIHPHDDYIKDENPWEEDNDYYTWATSPDNVTAILIGTTNVEPHKNEKLTLSLQHGIILKSFNAG